MRPCRGDLQYPACRFLPAKIGHVGKVPAWWQTLGLWRRQNLSAPKMVQQRHHVRRRDDRQVAGPGGFGPAALRADQVQIAGDSRHRRRQDPGDRFDGAVKRQLAKHEVTGNRIMRNAADGDKKAKRDRKVEMRAFLDQIGRCQIDGYPLRRQGQPDRRQRGPHTFPRFTDRLVGKAHNRHRWQTVRQMNLNLDGNGFDAAKGDGSDAGMHGVLTRSLGSSMMVGCRQASKIIRFF